MSRSYEDRLVLSSRYIHTGNSGVTLTLRRDLVRPDRAEMEIESGAFGAFHTSMQVRGNSSDGMTAIQLRDLALMFLDAADALDNDCRVEYAHQPGFSSLLGNDNRTDIVAEGGGNRLRPPQNLRRYIPGELEGIPLDPDIDLSKFAAVLNASKREKAETAVSIGRELVKVAKGQKIPDRSEEEREAARQKEIERRRADHIRSTGWNYLLAKRLLDTVMPFYKEARDEHARADQVKFVVHEE